MQAAHEGVAPTGREKRKCQRFFEQADILLFAVHQLVQAADGPGRCGSRDECDFIALSQCSRLDDAQIPARLAGLNDFAGKIGHFPAAAQLPAGLTRLRDLEPGCADGPEIADADFGFMKSFATDREIFAKGTVREIISLQFGFPRGVMQGGIDAEGFVGAAMIDEIGLSIPFESMSIEE